MSLNRSFAASLAVLALIGCASSSPPPQQRQPAPPPGDHERPIEPSPSARSSSATQERRDVLDADPRAYDPAPEEQAPPPMGPRPTVTLNRGRGGGLEQGRQYDIFATGEALVDPDTGEVLGSEETKVGRLTVTQVLPKFSKATLDGGSAHKGDICRPAQGPPVFSPHPGPSARKGKGGKATLAIAPFDFHRDVRAIPGADLETDAFTQKLVTSLVQTRKFDVVERSKLERLMQEHELGRSGMVDPARAAQARLLGADYFVMGEISVWTLTTDVRPVPHTDRFLRRSELRLIVDMRVVDTETSKIVSAEKGDVTMPWKEMFRGRPPARQALDPARLDDVQRMLIDQLVRRVVDAVYPVKVIAVSGQAAPPPPPRDRTPPRVEILAPRDGQTVNMAPVNVVVSASDDTGVTEVTINGARATRDSRGNYRVRISQPRDGANLVRAQARDAAGNTGEATIRFTFDATPPEVDGDATILVEGQVDDPESTVTVNGVEVEVDPRTGRYSARVPADPEDAGRIVIVATDPYGNQTREVRRVR